MLRNHKALKESIFLHLNDMPVLSLRYCQEVHLTFQRLPTHKSYGAIMTCFDTLIHYLI